MRTTDFELRPLTPLFGAEVSGVDLRQEQDDATKTALREAWRERGLLLFRGRELREEDVTRAASIFGEVSLEGGYPKFVSNVEREGRLRVDHELLFHMDFSFSENPLRGLALYGSEVVPKGTGGETLFASAKLAYDALPTELKARIKDLKITHSTGMIKDHNLTKEPRQATHPIAFPHPVTGATVLYCSPRHFMCIEGLSPDESQALCDELTSYVREPSRVYTHVWERGDFAVWDNLQLQHARNKFDPQFRRHLRRIQIAAPAAVPA